MSERDESLRAEYYAKHQAAYSKAEVGGVCVERLLWAQPGTVINRVEYIAVRGRLFVAGDLGEAIYSTGADSLAWWGVCDLHYFAGKCDASEYGRGYREWDADKASARVEAEVARMRADGQAVDDHLASEAMRAASTYRDEWEAWTREKAADLFGSDWWDFVPNFGVGPARRCALHLIGLKAALAQIAANASAVKVPA